MKTSVLLVVLSICISGLYAQEMEGLSRSEQRKLAKEQRKAEQEAINAEKKILTKKMLDYQRFVLEADHIGGKNGMRTPVSKNLNFVIIDSLDATLQLGSYGAIGPNGVGGVTVDGRVTNYKVSERTNKRGTNYNIMITIMTPTGSYHIRISCTETGMADAEVSGNRSGKVRYYGNLVALSQSKFYKGIPLF